MNPRILIVDDDERVLDALSRMFSEAGYAVQTHASGFGLIMAMRKFRPHVMLLDLEMPGLPGDAALRAIDGLDRVPFVTPEVVLFSGRPQDEIARRAELCNARWSVRKPASRMQLLEVIGDAMRVREETMAAPS
jgi:FixJ family two-component response regulator